MTGAGARACTCLLNCLSLVGQKGLPQHKDSKQRCNAAERSCPS